jgi:tetratricopeptide (TPR) repeat protein
MFSLKTSTLTGTIFLGFLFFLVACSTKRDSFLSRNSHALSTKYNILYNGQVGFDKGKVVIDAKNKDNYWHVLPIERMQIIVEDTSNNQKTKDSDFDLAETKATKAIQKHSMNIGGKEKNYQIDEAYLMLGKARYYSQRFVPALDAFNYILYKYPNSSKINEAKIWREKANMRLGNDAQVVKNISKLLKTKKLNNQVIADANALLSQTFLNLEEKDSAVAKLKIAEQFTKLNAEKARYRFILGQIQENLGQKEEAIASYQSVIAMKRKANKEYTIQAQARKSGLFDFEKGDTIAFLKTYNDLIKDRENRPFLDVIYHQLGLFYDKRKQQKSAEEFYNLSLRKAPTDKYLFASNYRNIANMYFKNANYSSAAKYYDSTLVHLESKTREFIHIQKTRKDLDEVIRLENSVKVNDSILQLVDMSEAEKTTYFETFIAALKKTDEDKKTALDKRKATEENLANTIKSNTQAQEIPLQDASGNIIKKPAMAPPSIAANSPNQTPTAFYFYNPTQVSFGKIEFKKNWGNRAAEGYWRITAVKEKIAQDSIKTTDKVVTDKTTSNDKIIEKYTTDFYLKQLPNTQVEIDSIKKERNFVYYQIGVIYKEKFKENQLAIQKLEQLLQQNPEEKLILPTLYHLYKMYQTSDENKAADMKSRITSLYPNSRYAQIITHSAQNTISENEYSDQVYTKVYRLFQEEQFSVVLQQLEALITQYTGNEIVPKFELLKANTLGKLKGLEAYKKAMQYVADNYPNSEEGIRAQEIITKQIPMLEGMEFSDVDTKKWKILYKIEATDDKKAKALEAKIKAFLDLETPKILTYSFDTYSETASFVTIHKVNSELYGNAIVAKLKDKFKVTEAGIVISDTNYNLIQIKKNLESYSATKKL